MADSSRQDADTWCPMWPGEDSRHRFSKRQAEDEFPGALRSEPWSLAEEVTCARFAASTGSAESDAGLTVTRRAHGLVRFTSVDEDQRGR